MPLSRRNQIKFTYSYQKVSNDWRTHLTLSVLLALAILVMALTLKVFYSKAHSTTDTRSKKAREFSLYANPSGPKNPKWDFVFHFATGSWELRQKINRNTDRHNKVFSFRGVYARSKTGAPPQFFCYWVTPPNIEKKENPEESFQSKSIYMSDLPPSLLEDMNYPKDHIISVQFQRAENQLSLKAKPLEESSEDWRFLSWKIKSTEETEEVVMKKTNPRGPAGEKKPANGVTFHIPYYTLNTKK